MVLDQRWIIHCSLHFLDTIIIVPKNSASTKPNLLLFIYFIFVYLHQKNAEICYEALLRIPELKPVMPCGAMYMMVSFVESLLSQIELKGLSFLVYWEKRCWLELHKSKFALSSNNFILSS